MGEEYEYCRWSPIVLVENRERKEENREGGREGVRCPRLPLKPDEGGEERNMRGEVERKRQEKR